MTASEFFKVEPRNPNKIFYGYAIHLFRFKVANWECEWYKEAMFARVSTDFRRKIFECIQSMHEACSSVSINPLSIDGIQISEDTSLSGTRIKLS